MGAESPPTEPGHAWRHEWKKPAAIIALVGTLISLVGGALWKLWVNRTQEEPVIVSEQVRQCVKAHDLRRAVDEYWYKDDESQRIQGRVRFDARTCVLRVAGAGLCGP